ncbi:MAG: hypothetical protein ABIJ56_12310 [Pseudomonadota bacterium]
MKHLILMAALFSLGACKAGKNSEAPASPVWIGTPAEESDWRYRYIIEANGEWKSGTVEYEKDGAWQEIGALSDMVREGDTITCRGPLGEPGKSFDMNYYFDILEKTDTSMKVRMTCDAFDSRSEILLFEKTAHHP